MRRLQATGCRPWLDQSKTSCSAFDSAELVAFRVPRSAFTLVELLVTVSIMAILITLTFAAFTRTADADRVRSAARQLQSYLEGARDRAIYAKEPRGVRFLLDPETPGTGIPQTVSSMVFIGAAGKYTTGTITLNDSTIPPTVTPSMDANWNNLIARGLLSATPRIKLIINASTSEYLHIARQSGGAGPDWQFTKPPTVAYTPLTVDYQYELELLPAVLPNQEPRLLASGISIDLSKSALPASWGTVNNYSNTMDVMFSPRGTIIGDVASTGLVHFFLADNVDVKQGRGGAVTNVTVNGTSSIDIEVDVDLSSVATGADVTYRAVLINATGHVHIMSNINSITGTTINLPYSTTLDSQLSGFPPESVRVEFLPERKSGDERIVTLTPQTGNISTYEVDQGDTFSLARSGAVAK